MIDNDENYVDLANLLDVSTAFVSAVMVGKKSVPEEWYEKFCDHYKLDETQKAELFTYYCDTKNTIKIDVSNANTNKKKLALQFQRRLPELSEEDLDCLFGILGEGGKNGL